MSRPLDPDQLERYSRNILIDLIGEVGQARLLSSSACVVGAGGLGSPALAYLAAAGLGRLTLIESDRVELSNLQRQVLHVTGDVGLAKTESARRRLTDLNPDCRLDVVTERLGRGNIARLVGGTDVVLDCTDNFATRLLLADHCWRAGLTLVSAAARRFEGLLMTLRPAPGNPCYRCFMPEAPPPEAAPGTEVVGVFGATPGVLGAQQALEAVKVLLDIGEGLERRVLIYDGLGCTFRTVQRVCDPACAFCAGRGPAPEGV
jgi:adenylyltransferase/sulfurtransferase